ncbi:hypothetical protein ACH5Y9_06750 [Methylomonas sp. BW4-1]|uniref:hypothetical protein n=1 Tax=unclassified Methylomonas TaxID=2608980 RepID=UPI000C32240B|nr:hypothetical protein [Methylomonas sp. Kb3]PKD39704.1 hypothetical protein CWO84_13970 [Methylomonas sp. Kb3]
MKKVIGQTPILIVLSSFSIFGCGSNESIETLVDQRVALASGVNFDTAKIAVLDPETGQELSACIQNKSDPRRNAEKVQSSTKDAAENCKATLLIDDNPALKAALELSKQTIQGEIKKDGEVKPARIVISITTLYKGSHCNVLSSGGDQYENCGRQR